MVIQHNISAINTHRWHGINNRRVAGQLERLSSGYRINRAADDAAGLAISEEMRRQITGLARGALNTQEGINLLQTAEGGCQEIHAILQRMQELAVQSSNGLYVYSDREKLDAEFQQLQEEIGRIAQSANFNGVQLLDGTHSKSAYALNGATSVQGTAVHMATPFCTYAGAAVALDAVTLPPQIPPPAGVASYSITGTNEITITGSGAFDISGLDGYAVKIASTAGQVHLTQTNASVVNNISIQCQSGNTDLFLEGLNTLNNTSTAAGHRSTIQFTGANNTLNLIGTNSLTQYVATRGSLYDSDFALINVGGTTELTIQNAAGHTGTLNATIDGDAIQYRSNLNKGAAIGGNDGQDIGTLTIAGGTVNAKVLTTQAHAAAIGGGYMYGRSSTGGTIRILDGTVNATMGQRVAGRESNPNAAAIGGGNFGSAGVIEILGGTVTAQVISGTINNSDSQGAAIGSGFNAANNTSSQITISGGTVVASVVSEKAEGAAIGGGGISDGGNITITGGDVTVSVTSPKTWAAAIGGGSGSDSFAAPNPGNGGNLSITGGIVKVTNGWIGAGYGDNNGNPTTQGTAGTTHITGGTLVIDHSLIQGGVGTASGQYGHGENAQQIYRVAVMPSEIGFSFPADSEIEFIVDGQYYSWKTDPLPHQGSMYLYLLDDGAGGRTNVDIIYDGKLYKGYAEVADDHTAIWRFNEIGEVPEQPDPPEPTDPPDPGDPPEETLSGGLIIHWGPNSNNFVRIYLEGVSTAHLGLVATNVLTQENANRSLSRIAGAIDVVSAARTSIGAYQNRLEHMRASNLITKEALTAAESTIRDADMATEIMIFAKQELLVQFTQAMLAHTRSQPQQILQLLS